MMTDKKLVLVICALGYATSTMIKKNIEEFLDQNNMSDWEVEAIGVNQASTYLPDAKVIVTSLELKQEEYDVPVINGVSLISGINKEETLNKILDVIKNL